ncbi:MAG: addiction module protein [Planctomycetota bacterium]
MTLQEIRATALQLDDNDRELLAVELLESLTTAASQSEIDDEWKIEILSRSASHRDDESNPIDANESLQRIRDRIQRGNPQ